jgi:hypothetical protein
VRQSLFAVALAAMPLMMTVQASAGDFMALGVGTMPCSYWLSTPQLEGEGDAWILGWWTALNQRNNNHWVGGHTDGFGITTSIKKECRQKPDKLLMRVIDEVFSKMEHPDR